MKKLSFIIVILFSVLLSSNLRAEIVKELAPHTACVIFKVGSTVTIYHFDQETLSYYPKYNWKIVVDRLKNPKRTTLIDLENEVPEEAVNMIVGHNDGHYDSYEKENGQLNEKIFDLQYPEVTKDVKTVIGQDKASDKDWFPILLLVGILLVFIFGYWAGSQMADIRNKRKNNNLIESLKK